MKDMTVYSNNPLEYRGERVLTTQMLAGNYETTQRRISENYSRNESKYIEEVHYFFLEGSELKAFKNQYAKSVVVDPKAPSLYLWTKRGAFLHAKSLGTDAAWATYENLIDCYFVVEAALSSGVLAPGDEIRLKRIEVMERNASIREAQILQKAAECIGVTPIYQRILHAKAVETVTGQKVLPYQTAEKNEYPAAKAAQMAGLRSGQAAGKLANLLGLKAEKGGENQFGRWIHTKSPHSVKEVLSWVYYDEGVEALKEAAAEGTLCKA